MRRIVLPIAFALVAVACGQADRSPGSEGGAGDLSTTQTGDQVVESDTGEIGDPEGSLRITQHQTACCYTEGQISFLRLSGRADVVLDRGYKPLASKSLLEFLSLPPGDYTLESWQQPCSASCPELDEHGMVDEASQGGVDTKADQCQLDLSIAADEHREVLIEFAPGEGCAMTLPADRPQSDVPDSVALRWRYPNCGEDIYYEELVTVGPDEYVGDVTNPVRRCFLDAYLAGATAEFTAYEPQDDDTFRFVIYQADGTGSVIVMYTDDWMTWTGLECTEVTEAPPGYEFEVGGCVDSGGL